MDQDEHCDILPGCLCSAADYVRVVNHYVAQEKFWRTTRWAIIPATPAGIIAQGSNSPDLAAVAADGDPELDSALRSVRDLLEVLSGAATWTRPCNDPNLQRLPAGACARQRLPCARGRLRSWAA